MRRRSALTLFALAGLAGCSEPGAAVPVPSSEPSTADYQWPRWESGLGAGFCFTLVEDLTPAEVVERLGGEELERVEWLRLVAAGDGEQAGADRYFLGVARIDDWSVIVEDNGSLGVTQRLVSPLSRDGRVLAYRGDAEGAGRLLVLRNGDLELDFDSRQPDRWGGLRPGDYMPAMRAAGLLGGSTVTHPTGPALAFLAGQTGVSLTRELLAERTYLLVTVPKV
ncbi:DUF6461 domain-containing protein [Actinoplanes sp. NPDC051861]|uniref:DUF6461 domain-containing protein n=1 Tax=Actinoplanes sp. NPDC051861 TaxID=3155170 RepID=UPI00343C8AF0